METAPNPGHGLPTYQALFIGVMLHLSAARSDLRCGRPGAKRANLETSVATSVAKGGGSVSQTGMALAPSSADSQTGEDGPHQGLLATRRSVGVAAYAYSMERVDNAAKRLQKNRC